MSGKKRFFRDGAMLTIVALSSRSVSMIFSSFLAKSVGSVGVGLFTLIMTVYAFALTFATSGIGITVTRLVAANYKKRRGILRSSLIYASIFGILAVLILIFFSELISEKILSEVSASPLLRILAPSLIFVSLGTAFNGYFVGVKRVRANAAVQIFGQLARVIISAILVITFGKGNSFLSLMMICTGILITEILCFLLIVIQYILDAKIYATKDKSPAKIKKIANIAMPLAFSQYVRSLLLSWEHILIPRRLTYGGLNNSDALASYGVLHGMALPAVLFPMSPLSSFSGLLVPEFAEDQAKGNRERMSRLTSQAFNSTLVYATSVSVLIFFFSDELGFALYNSFEAGYYLRILSFVIPIMYLDHVTDQILKGIGEHVYSMWVNIADSCLSLLLVYFLLPKMGIIGYAVVIILMEAFNFIMSVTRLSTRVSLRPKILKSMALPAALSVISCGLTNRIFAFNGASSATPWLIAKILFAICALVFLDRIVIMILCKVYKNKKMPKSF